MPEITMRVEEGTLLILNGTQISMDDTHQIVYAQSQPRLVIEEQPASVFRFRYQSEHGSHGSLMGESSDKGKKTYPRIRIENFVGRAKFLVSLYTYKDEETNGPGSPGVPVRHVHMLHGKGCNKDTGFCEVEYDIPEEGKSVDFPNLYISHVAKRQIPQILCERYLQEHIQEIAQLAEVGWGQYNKCSVVDEETAANMKRKADSDAKSMEKKLNSVVLCFEAYARIQDSWVSCCEPVFSTPINNQKAAATGSLKICRIDRTAGSIKGGDDVFILCEKVDKKNIKVRFYKSDEDWEDYGHFNEFDVHHQYAIVFKTPKYKDTSVEEDVHVQIELYRPTDGATSNSVNYTYTPDDDFHLQRKKRKLIDCQSMFKDSKSGSCMEDPGSSFMDRKPSSVQFNLPSTSCGSNSGNSAAGYKQEPSTADVLDEVLDLQAENPFIPRITYADVPPPYISAFLSNHTALASNIPVTSPNQTSLPNQGDPLIGQSLDNGAFELQELLADVDGGGPFNDVGGPNIMLSNYEHSNLDFGDLQMDSAVQPVPSQQTKDSKMVSRGPSSVFDDDLQTDGIGSVGQTRVAPPASTKSEATIPAAVSVLKHGQNGKMTENELVYSLALHTAKKLQDYARTSDIQHLLMTMRHLAAVSDDNGDNAIHLASIHSQFDAINHLVKVADPDPINAFNELIQTPLHIAVHINSPKIVAILLQNGADISLLDRYGNSALHIAAKHNKPEIVRVITDKKNYCKKLTDKTPVLDSLNYDGYAPLHLAVLAKSLDCVKLLCAAKCDINVADGTSGRTALHLAIENHREDISEFLLTQNSLHVDYQAFNGYTPLHLACSMNLASTVKLLMSYDADPYVETCEPVQEALSSDEEPNTPDSNEAKPNVEEERFESRGCNSFDIAKDHEKILDILRDTPDFTSETALKHTFLEFPDVPDTNQYTKEPIRSVCTQPPGDSGLGLEYEDSRQHPEKDSGYIDAKTAYDLIDEPTRIKLAKLLDGSHEKNWKALSRILDMSKPFESVFESSESPTLVLLQYIDTINELYYALEAMGHQEAVELVGSVKDAIDQHSSVPGMTTLPQQALSQQMSKLKL